MRRSAAPSQCQGLKRPRFTPPYLTPSKINDADSVVTKDISAHSNKCGHASKKFCTPRRFNKPERVLAEENIDTELRVSNLVDKPQVLEFSENNIELPSINKPLDDITNTSLSTNSNNGTIDSIEHVISNDQNCNINKLEIPHNDTDILKPKIGCRNEKFVTPSNSKSLVSAELKEEDEPDCNYYAVLWCKMSKKKHKKWEGDALLATKGKSVRLIDLDGKEIGKGSGYKASELSTMEEGHSLFIGGKEIEVMNRLTKEDWESGRCFNAASSAVPAVTSCAQPRLPAVNKGFTKPTNANTSSMKSTQPISLVPLFDPSKPGSLVLPRPTSTQQWNHPSGCRGTVDVVVDPHLSKRLRPHQRQGVVFLYECMLGLRNDQGCGAILADDMGLGKTLQCITIIWTLLKQNPFSGSPMFRRVLIVTPGSLVKNWCREFRKWLGNERIKVFAVSGEKKVQEFLHSPVYPVMVISYEMFVRSIDDVRRCKFDIMICDEGHRLKNTGIKTTTLLSSLQVRRRILLTGTPIQNDLQEFYSLIEFCNPGILGSSTSFHHVYEAPIVSSQQPAATQEEKQLGRARAAELSRITKQFVLRRTQDIINKYLPPKVENVVFCRPSKLQLKLYQSLLESRVLKECLTARSNGALHLMCIAAIKKLCSGPSLVLPACIEAHSSEDVEKNSTLLYQGLLSLYPDYFTNDYFDVEHSGKLKVLSELLESVHQEEPDSKVVVVSAYTQTLDLLQRLCVSASYKFCRLDGSTPTTKRQNIVESFNSNYSNDFIFLLSSKAGGVGLNLIGASRLVLYDVDWNPANDLQAMARIWRDGQTKDVHIYRLLTTGTIEEKIYQRQISKQGLSGAVVDANVNSKSTFSTEELKDLFTLHIDTSCVTHDLLTCDCGSNSHSIPNKPPIPVEPPRRCQLGQPSNSMSRKSVSMHQLLKWQHIPGSKSFKNQDVHLQSEAITFIFRNEANQTAIASDLPGDVI